MLGLEVGDHYGRQAWVVGTLEPVQQMSPLIDIEARLRHQPIEGGGFEAGGVTRLVTQGAFGQGIEGDASLVQFRRKAYLGLQLLLGIIKTQAQQTLQVGERALAVLLVVQQVVAILEHL